MSVSGVAPVAGGVVDNIHVAIRARPLNDRETSSGQSSAWVIANNSLYIPHPVDGKPVPGSNYVFDKVFDDKSLNSNVYDDLAKDIVMSTLEGVNGTIFAYGQTSSGKTFTMMGAGRYAGIIPMAIRDIFLYIAQTPDREFLLRVSYLEIYNEVIKDLLSPENDNLKIHENPNREIFVGGLTEEIVLTPEEVMRLMSKGENNRHTGETNMNERSSRSHTIFRMVIESRERLAEGESGSSRSSYSGAVKVSSLSLVDLAGSERVGHTGAEGIRLREGGHINKSLLTLGTVIGKLSEGSDKVHIPYRDSKLTRILQPSLGGNARTAIICTITLAQAFSEETISTLKFASRAKTIRNRPEVNEVISDEALLKRYKKEIDSLKAQLDELKSSGPASVAGKPTRTIEEQQMLQAKFEELRTMILNSRADGQGGVPAKKAKVLRRQTWFPGVNATYEDEDDEEEPSKPSEDPATSTPGPNPRVNRSSDTNSASTTKLTANQQFQIEILRTQLGKMSAELNSLKSSERTLRQEQETLNAALEKMARGDIFDDSTGAVSEVAKELQRFVRNLVLHKEKLESIDATARERDKFLQLENESLSQTCLELEENNQTLLHQLESSAAEKVNLESKIEELTELAKMANHRADEIDRARQEVSQLKQTIEAEARQVQEQLRSEVDELSEKNAELSRIVEEVIVEREALATAAEEVAADTAQAKADAERTMLEVKEAAEAQQSELQAKVAQLEEAAGSLQVELEQAHEVIQVLEAGKEEMTVAHQGVVEVLQKELEEAKAAVDAVRQAGAGVDAQVSLLVAEKEQLVQQHQETLASLATTKEELSRAETWMQKWDAEKLELTAANETLETQLAEAETTMAAKEDKIVKLTQELEALRGSAGAQSSNLASLSERNAELAEKTAQLEADLKSLELERDNLRLAMDKAKSKLDEQTAEVEQLKGQVAELSERDGESIELLHQMQGVIEKLKDEKALLEQQRGSSAAGLEEAVVALQDQLRVKEEEVRQLQSTVAAAQESSESAEQFALEINRLEDENATLQGTIGTLREQLESVQVSSDALGKVVELETQLAALRKENEELLEVNDSATQALVELEALKKGFEDDAVQEKSNLVAKVEALEAELAAARESARAVVDSSSGDKEALKQLEELNDNLQEELTIAKEELDRVKSQFQAQRNKAIEDEAELAMLQAEASSSAARVEFLEHELASTRDQLENLGVDNLKLSDELHLLRTEFADQRAKYQERAGQWAAEIKKATSSLEDYDKLSECLAERENACVQLQSKVESLEENLDKSRRELELRANYHAALKEELASAQAVFAEYNDLRDREDDMVAQLNKASAKVEELGRENRQLRDSVQQANAAVTLQEQKMLAMSERISLMSEELKLESERSRASTTERDAAVKEAKDLKSLVEGYQKERRLLMETRSKLEADLDLATQEIHALRSEQATAVATSRTLEQRIAEATHVIKQLEGQRQQLREDLANREAEVFEQSRTIDRLRKQSQTAGAAPEEEDSGDQGRWHKMYLDMQRQGREETDKLRAELDKMRTLMEREQQKLKQKIGQLSEDIAASEKMQLQGQQMLAHRQQEIVDLEDEIQRLRASSRSTDMTTLQRPLPVATGSVDDTQHNMAVRLQLVEKEMQQLTAENEKLRTQLRTNSLMVESVKSDHIAETMKLKEENQRLGEQIRTAASVAPSVLAPRSVAPPQPSATASSSSSMDEKQASSSSLASASTATALRRERTVKASKENSDPAVLANAPKPLVRRHQRAARSANAPTTAEPEGDPECKQQ